MRRRIVLMLAVAASLTLIPAPSHASTCAAADPTADAVVCEIVYGTVFSTCEVKTVGKICQYLE